MKNPSHLLIKIAFLFLIAFPHQIKAQDCTPPQAKLQLDANNISTTILNGGDLFWNRTSPIFKNDASSNPSASSIFVAGLLIGGFTGLPNNPDLKMAGAGYNTFTSYDFSAGPLDENGTTDQSICTQYNQLWEVFGTQIKSHLDDFADNGIIDNPQANIFGYPAQGNIFFEAINGFTLPNTPQGLAPFWDTNANGIYNPDQGEYPLPTAVHQNHYPAQLIWGIFNDAGSNHTYTQGATIGAEIQLTAWAFSCTDNDLLKNTIFTSHKIINRSTEFLDSTFVGMFVDFDLGCQIDDYVGSIPSMNTFYGFNMDNLDGDSSGNCPSGTNTYETNPPVQAITYLNQTMSSFGTFSLDVPTPNYPQLPANLYNMLTGSWLDGVPFTQGGNGYDINSSQTTSFLFDGNPNESSEWSMTEANLPAGDFRAMSSVGLDRLAPQASATIDMAYTFYQDENLDNLETVNLVYENTPALQAMYDDRFLTACTDLYLPTENLERSRIEIFPNPTSNFLNIKIENPAPARFTIFDMYGKKVLEKMENTTSDILISTAHLSAGIYFLRIEMEGKWLVEKFVKM